MNINRNNYEEFFVLYIDNELNSAERAAVEDFVKHNPDLKAELEMLEQTILPSDTNHVFENKELLFRKEAEPASEVINELNCEEFFVLYADGELNNSENGLVEEFIYRHPQYQENFELIHKIKFQPEKHIVFPNKSVLYRSENDNKVVPMFRTMRTWKMVAAAAVMLMIGGTAWYALNNNQGPNSPGNLAVNDAGSTKSAVPGIKKSATQQPQTTETGVTSGTTISPLPSAGDNQAADVAVEKTKVTSAQSSTKAAMRNAADENIRSIEKSFAAEVTKKDKNQSNIADIPNVQQEKGLTKTNSNKDIIEKTDVANRSNGTDKNNQGDKSQLPGQKELANKNALIPTEQPGTNELLAVVNNDKGSTENTVAIGPVQLKPDNVFAKMLNENDEEFEQSDKKNKMRGFFRKVTRVFDKATSREPAEERKGVRIASFSIGLK